MTADNPCRSRGDGVLAGRYRIERAVFVIQWPRYAVGDWRLVDRNAFGGHRHHIREKRRHWFQQGLAITSAIARPNVSPKESRDCHIDRQADHDGIAFLWLDRASHPPQPYRHGCGKV